MSANVRVLLAVDVQPGALFNAHERRGAWLLELRDLRLATYRETKCFELFGLPGLLAGHGGG